MTETVSAYCTLDNVRARTLQRIGPRDNPSAATVEEWILNGTYRINGELYLYEPPFTTQTALQIIKPLNIDYAAARVYGALQDESQATRLDQRFEEILERIKKGEINLGLSRKARFRGGGRTCPPKKTLSGQGSFLGLPSTSEVLGLP